MNAGRVLGKRRFSNPRLSLLHGKVWSELQSWGGFKVFSKLMRELPRLQVFLAGGALRDILLDGRKSPKDFDFFISGADIRSVISILKRGGRVGFGPFGSPRWFPAGDDTRYCDLVHIRHFYNGLWWCADIVDALNQFDFTANAVAIELRTGVFFDPLNGWRDIRKRIMRAVRFDYPDEPISDVYSIRRLAVLWFRILHYAAVCHMKIEPITLSWLIRNRSYREHLSSFSETFFTPDPGAKMIYRGSGIREPGWKKRGFWGYEMNCRKGDG